MLMVFNNKAMIDQVIANGYKIVAISENNIDPNFIKASLLLPPFEAMSELVDGNLPGFRAIYWNHLAQRECDFFLCVIYTALISGVKMAIYLDNPDEIGISILSAFSQYMQNSFGIIPDAPQYGSVFMVNSQFALNNLNRVYLHNLIDGREYLMRYPGKGFGVNMVILNKLINDIKPWIKQNSTEEYVKVFAEMKDQLQSCGRYLAVPIYSDPVELNTPEEVLEHDSIYW